MAVDLVSANVSGVDETAAQLDLAARRYEKWAAGDRIRLVVGLVVLSFGLFLAAVAQNTIGGAEADLVAWFNRLPDRTIGLVVGTGQLIVIVVPLAVWALLLWRRHFRLWGMQVLAMNAASWTLTLIESRYADRLGVIEDTHAITRGWVANTGFPTSSAIAASVIFNWLMNPNYGFFNTVLGLVGIGPQRWLDEPRAAIESLVAIRRAGADQVITYYAKEVARWLSTAE